MRLDPGGDDDFWLRPRSLYSRHWRIIWRRAAPVRARRRLFAEDAAQGFALADLVAQRFDVVLMNPPFGAGSLVAKRLRDGLSENEERRVCRVR